MRISVCPLAIKSTTLKSFEVSASLSGGSVGAVFDHPDAGESKITFIRVPADAKKKVVNTLSNPAYVSLFEDRDGDQLDSNILVCHKQCFTLRT
jgi:hypothetical protein